ncbi:MAG: phospho-N-acetylmuramoyl-pentapeptide-transferase, partial [Acidimicrobiaceae bacterium]|nr:phospho-N-acetylmuramoyl-pentapeptide-transferase [Acidimicrobiaceae bacterium]
MIRLLIAGCIAMFVSLLGCWILIRVLVRYGIGQPIRDDGPQEHRLKSGTPTMGGIAVVFAATVGYVVSDVFGGIYTRTGIIVMV